MGIHRKVEKDSAAGVEVGEDVVLSQARWRKIITRMVTSPTPGTGHGLQTKKEKKKL